MNDGGAGARRNSQDLEGIAGASTTSDSEAGSGENKIRGPFSAQVVQAGLSSRPSSCSLDRKRSRHGSLTGFENVDQN